MYCAGRISTYGEDPNDPKLLLSRVLDYGVIRLLEEQIELKKKQFSYAIAVTTRKDIPSLENQHTLIEEIRKIQNCLGGVLIFDISLTNSTAMSPLATASMASGTQKTWGV